MASTSILPPQYTRKNDKEKPKEIMYHIVLESSSLESETSAEESIFSLQANTTVSANDTSDTSTDDSRLKYYMSEFEINSGSEFPSHPWAFDPDVSSSTTAHDVNVPEPVKVNFSSGNEAITDGSDTKEEKYGVRLSAHYYQNCAQCFGKNPNPAFRFCDTCFQVRKEFFPSKPTSKKRKSKSVTKNSLPVKKIRCDELRGGEIRVLQQPNVVDRDDGGQLAASLSVQQDSGFESQLSQSNDESGATPKDKCLTCLSNVVNGLFVHGRTAHKCCCHKCSKRIWLQTKCCPICRRKVSNVIALLNY